MYLLMAGTDEPERSFKSVIALAIITANLGCAGSSLAAEAAAAVLGGIVLVVGNEFVFLESFESLVGSF